MPQNDPSPLPPANTPELPAASPPEEPTSMLDIHPAHHAASTWRDFLIHIATICIGLLIAIGLEQSVEWIHHRHQLHQLEQDLHTEGLRNLHVALSNIVASERQRQFYAAQYAELLHASHQHRVPLLLPLPGIGRYAKPAYAVWAVAQQSGTAGLLERADAQRYVRLYSVAQIAGDQIDIINAASQRRGVAMLPGIADPSTLKTFSGLALPSNYDLSRLTPDDMREFRDTLGNDMMTARMTINRNLYLYGIEWAVLQGSRSDEENVRAIYEAQAAYVEGGTSALLAKYPPPDDPASQAPHPEEEPR